MNKKRSAKLRMVWRRCSNCGTTLKVPYKDIRKMQMGMKWIFSVLIVYVK